MKTIFSDLEELYEEKTITLELKKTKEEKLNKNNIQHYVKKCEENQNKPIELSLNFNNSHLKNLTDNLINFLKGEKIKLNLLFLKNLGDFKIKLIMKIAGKPKSEPLTFNINSIFTKHSGRIDIFNFELNIFDNNNNHSFKNNENNIDILNTPNLFSDKIYNFLKNGHSVKELNSEEDKLKFSTLRHNLKLRFGEDNVIEFISLFNFSEKKNIFDNNDISKIEKSFQALIHMPNI